MYATHYVYHYDRKNSLGQRTLQIEITDPKGKMTTQPYDALGRLREETSRNPLNRDILSKQELFYDPLGRVIKTIDAVIVNGVVQRDYVVGWRYYFNEQEDLIEEGVGSFQSKRTYWSYNSHGQREVQTKPDGTTITHRYDPQGRLKEIFSNDKTIHYTYTYDRCHRIIKVEDQIHQTETKELSRNKLCI